MKRILFSKNAPAPIGAYSQAVASGSFVFTSAQIALTPEGKIVSDDIKEQAKQVMENLKNILKDNNSSLDSVVKVTIYLSNLEDFSAVNEVYSEYFTESFPARTTIEVSGLPKNSKIAIDMIACLNT